MKKLILQAIHLLRQNPFYSLVAIIGTAVTIAFVMVVNVLLWYAIDLVYNYEGAACSRVKRDYDKLS